MMYDLVCHTFIRKTDEHSKVFPQKRNCVISLLLVLRYYNFVGAYLLTLANEIVLKITFRPIISLVL